MFSRFDAMHKCDRHMNGQTDRIAPQYIGFAYSVAVLRYAVPSAFIAHYCLKCKCLEKLLPVRVL